MAADGKHDPLLLELYAQLEREATDSTVWLSEREGDEQSDFEYVGIDGSFNLARIVVELRKKFIIQERQT